MQNLSPRLVMTLCVKNEADILRENLEFHLNSGVDFFIVTDNRSTDETKSILLEYQERGIVRYIYSPSPFFDQRKLVTHMARMAVNEYSAEWVINNDADEFWWASGSSLKSAISAISIATGGDALMVKRTDFVSTPEHETSSTPFYQNMIYRRLKSTNSLGRALPPKITHRGDPSVQVGAGNHDADGDRIKLKANANPAQLEVLHFPLRSYSHLIRKATSDYRSHRKSIYFCSQAVTYKEYNRLYKDGQLEEYYNDYCGGYPPTKDAEVIIDERLKNQLTKIMRGRKKTDPVSKFSSSYSDKLKQMTHNLSSYCHSTLSFYARLMWSVVFSKRGGTKSSGYS